MNNKTIVIIVAVLGVALFPLIISRFTQGETGTASQATGPAAPSISPQASTVAQEVATALIQSNYAAVVVRFDSTMRAALPESKLSDTMAQVIGQIGAFKQQLNTRTEKVNGMDLVFITCEFERAKAVIQVTLNATGQVAGLFVRPAA